VAAAHKRHHRKLHLGPLADDYALDILNQTLGGISGVQGAPPLPKQAFAQLTIARAIWFLEVQGNITTFEFLVVSGQWSVLRADG
jgi:hypothetical protein